MTEETFEDKFPSLKDEKTRGRYLGSIFCISCDDVARFCIDKQKVKDAIEFIFRDKSGIRLADYDYLKEELGLDK